MRVQALLHYFYTDDPPPPHPPSCPPRPPPPPTAEARCSNPHVTPDTLRVPLTPFFSGTRRHKQ